MYVFKQEYVIPGDIYVCNFSPCSWECNNKACKVDKYLDIS